MKSKNQRDVYHTPGWGERRDPRARQCNRLNEEEQGCVNKTDILILLSMFTYLCECICEEQPCVCEQEKCQVGEKYLSTGEEKCYKATQNVHEIDIVQENNRVIDKV